MRQGALSVRASQHGTKFSSTRKHKFEFSAEKGSSPRKGRSGSAREMAGAASLVRNVFVYGSLLAPEVLVALLDRNPPSAQAVVHDFHRYSIKGRIYPAALPVKGSKVTGKVLYDLTDEELEVLDEFEDVEYFKLTVDPVLLDMKGSELSIASGLKANIYVWTDSQDKNLYGDWDYEIWREQHLSEFLEKYLNYAK